MKNVWSEKDNCNKRVKRKLVKFLQQKFLLVWILDYKIVLDFQPLVHNLFWLADPKSSVKTTTDFKLVAKVLIFDVLPLSDDPQDPLREPLRDPRIPG
jgi:hypothetical protein